MQAHASAAASAAGRGGAVPRPFHHPAPCQAAAPSTSGSSSNTPRRRLGKERQQSTRCRAAPPQPSGGAGPLLASIRRGQGLEGVLGAPSRQQQPPSQREAAEAEGDPPPNAPVTPHAFVEALETLSRSASGSEVNPAQLDEVLSEVVERGLLGSFSDAQLVGSAKALAVLCASVAAEFTTALVMQLGQRLGSLHTAQLSNVGWAMLRLVPVTHAEARGVLGMSQAWLDAYAAACEAQLQQVLQPKQQQQQQQQPQQQQPQQQQHQRLPSAQQLANLLLIPAAVQQAPAPALVSLLEQAVVARQHSLCGFAVAQLLTIYVRLELQPGHDLWAALREHLTEELLLYDYDELAQVTFSAFMLQLELPDPLLADITRRAEALQEAGAAAASDVAILRGSLERLAAQRAAAVGAARWAGR